MIPETIIKEVEKEIDLQIAMVDKILDKRGNSGQHFDDFLVEAKAKLYGMLHIYWLIGGTQYPDYKIKK
jgi:hypothetical protein